MTKQDDRIEIPDWKCERYLLGELDEREMEHIRLRLQHDADLRARLERLERSNRDLLERYPAARMSDRIERKLAAARLPSLRPADRPSWWRPVLVGVPAAAAVAVAAFLWLNPGTLTDSTVPGGVPGQSTTRIKGSAAVLNLYRWTPQGSVRLENGDLVAEHDRIRASYRSDGQTWGLILSVDGRGVLTRHHPQHGGPARLEAGGPHPLDFSYELDDAPRWEIFILAASPKSFDADAVIDSIESSPLVRTPGMPAPEAESVLKSLPLPPEVSLTTFTLIKGVSDE